MRKCIVIDEHFGHAIYVVHPCGKVVNSGCGLGVYFTRSTQLSQLFDSFRAISLEKRHNTSNLLRMVLDSIKE